ncbi:MAG TPA: hypothetical protein V6D19_06665 [Stenomitos sp.]
MPSLTLQPSAAFAIATEPKTIRALCAYEGSFTSMSGAERTFTPKLLGEIAAASNKHLNSGIQVPVFHSNHDYSSKDKIGLIVGPFAAQPITADDLPDPNLTDLIGKVGVFTFIKLIKEEAIADYEAKLLKPISMGIDFKGETFTKNAIYEISCVGFSAIPGAQLFSKGTASMGVESVDFAALAEQAFYLAQYGLNLNDRIAQEQLMPNLWRLFDAFTGLIREIYEEDDPEMDKDALINQAVSDLTVAIASRLRTNPVVQMSAPDPEDDPADPEEIPPETDPEEDMSELEDLKQEFAAFKLATTVSAKANELFNKQYLTPAQLKEFETSTETPALIEKFAAAGDKTASGAIAGLNKKLIELEAIEKYGTPQVSFGLRIGGEPLPQGGQQPDAQVEEEAKGILTYALNNPTMF